MIRSRTCCCPQLRYFPAGSRHAHALQKFFFTLPPWTVFAQQSPPSNAQPQLLFSSSQLPSPLYFGNLQWPLQLVSLRFSGSTHLQTLQYFVPTTQRSNR